MIAGYQLYELFVGGRLLRRVGHGSLDTLIIEDAGSGLGHWLTGYAKANLQSWSPKTPGASKPREYHKLNSAI